MRIVEAGGDALSAEVDAASACARESEHFSVRADGKYTAAGDGERLNIGVAGTHRQDPAVVQNHVRAGVPARERGGGGAEAGGDDGTAADGSSHGFSSRVIVLTPHFDRRRSARQPFFARLGALSSAGAPFAAYRSALAFG